MAKLTGEAKREFLERMARGRAKSGRGKATSAKPRKGSGSYVVTRAFHNDAETVVSNHRTADAAVARAKRVLSGVGEGWRVRVRMPSGQLIPDDVWMNYGGARRRVGKAKKSAAKKPRAKKSTRGLATTRGAAALGKGSTATRLHTVETAVRDLATANRAIVSKVVDHEKRLQKTETILDRWARGRGK